MQSISRFEQTQAHLQQWADRFNDRLAESVCPVADGNHDQAPPGTPLAQAMRYAVLGPGKRLRPYLLCRCYELCGGHERDAWPIAVAVECVHAFSLVHDDLPAMDDDALRRGRATTHVRFGEALAILAGDALLSLAFELIAEHAPDARRAGLLTGELARAVGAGGMIGGQAADMQSESTQPDAQRVADIHDRKTARFFEATCRMGGLLADADQATLDSLGVYGTQFGRAFQIIDDVLDETSCTEGLGKTAGKDARSGKQTYPQCVGLEASRARAAACAQRAVESLERFDERSNPLRELAPFVLERRR
ncbi:MAG: polyprenyl synthetase family protein [Phycisphaerae bacterium]